MAEIPKQVLPNLLAFVSLSSIDFALEMQNQSWRSHEKLLRVDAVSMPDQDDVANDIDPSFSDMSRRIGFLIFPDFHILDLTGPLSAFDMSGRSAASPPHEVPTTTMS